MQLRGHSARTLQAYTRALAQLAQDFQRSPEQLNYQQVSDEQAITS